MKAKIFCLFFLIVLEFIVCPQNGWTQDNTIPMIGAYYFDGWSGKNNSQELWAQEAPTHLTEKLYNDYNERQPIWGWRNDDLAIMERQIDIASQNGIIGRVGQSCLYFFQSLYSGGSFVFIDDIYVLYTYVKGFAFGQILRGGTTGQ